MKKILCFILIAVLSLGVLTSCDQIGGAWDSISGTVGGFIDGILGNDQQPAGPTLEDAANFLNDIYKDKNATTRTDFDVVGRVIVNGVTFPVTWASDNEAVTVRPSTKTGYYTVDLPDVNGAEFNYTLTATITDAEGNTTTKSYTFTVPVIDNSGITSTPVEGVAYKLFLLQGSENRRYYALNTTQNNENKFINTTLDPKAGAEFYVEKVDGGYKIYTEVNGVKTYMYAKVTRTEDATTGTVKYSKYIGFNAEEGSVFTYSETKGGVWTVTVDSLVYGVGTYGSYTTISISDESYFTPEKVGSSQFVLQFMTAEHANTLEEDKLPDSPSDAEGILNQLYALADGESATGEFTITGKIIELDSYNNPTIVVEGFENMPVYCYRLSVEAKVGDIITVKATQMKNYGGTYEFMNCTLVTEDSGETPSTPSDLGIVDNPEVGKAYKFGLFHGNENATVFFNGQNYNSYAWYLAYDATGVDVYLEAVEGVENAYRLFFYNGEAKTYIVAFPRDGDTTKGTLKLDTTCPAEYFTFNSEYNTLVYTSTTGEQFYLGSSGTYKSISCSAISYITGADSYIAHLYAEGATGSEGGSSTPDPDPTPDPTPDPANPVVGKAYDLYMQLPSGKVYFAGSMSGDYLATTTDATASVKVFFEAVNGGYHIYFMNGDVKTYITASAYLKSNGYAGCHFYTTTDTPTLAWTYDTTYGIIEIYDEIDGKSDTFFAGTYGTYSTVSLSGAFYKDQIASGTQYPAQFELAESGEVTPPEGGEDTHEHNFVDGKCECGADDPNYVPDTPVEPDDGMVTISQALASGEGTKVKFTGTVHSFYEDWSSFNNCSPYIVDDAGNKILVFRTTTHVYVGDVVTVEGTITIYNNVAQIAKDASTVTVTTAHTCSFSAATCVDDSACTSCGKAGTDVALGHTQANAEGKCDRCGIDLGATYVENELSFASKDNRTTFTTSQQVWVANGVTLTNDKSASTSNVADYANPARFYKSSKITVECANMTKIEFVCNSGSYATALQNSIATNANYTVSVSGSTVTVTFVDAVDSFVIDNLSGGQVRMNSLTVTAIG